MFDCVCIIFVSGDVVLCHYFDGPDSTTWLIYAAVGLPAAPRNDPAPGWWLQLGAFREREGAELLQQRAQREADWLAPLAVFDAPAGYRVQAGPYGSRAEALNAAERLHAALHLRPLVVQRR